MGIVTRLVAVNKPLSAAAVLYGSTNDVLNNLVDAGYMSAGQVHAARLNPARIIETRITHSPDWFLDWAYKETLDVINEMKQQNVKLVLVEPYFDLKTPNAIGRATGAAVLVMPPSVGGVKEITDYISLFDYDVMLLVNAMKAAK